MSAYQGDSRQAGDGQDRLGGEIIFFPRLAELLHRLRTMVVPATNAEGVEGWRLRRDPPGVASLFFATGREKPDNQLIDAALRTVGELALDHDAYSITIEVRKGRCCREPELDVYIGR